MSDVEKTGRLGFLDSVGRLFHGKEEAVAPREGPQAAGFAVLQVEFEGALNALSEKVAEQARTRGASAGGATRGKTGAELAAE